MVGRPGLCFVPPIRQMVGNLASEGGKSGGLPSRTEDSVSPEQESQVKRRRFRSVNKSNPSAYAKNLGLSGQPQAAGKHGLKEHSSSNEVPYSSGKLKSALALASSQANLEEVNRTRQKLESYGVRRSSMPSWQPECPFAASDEELARRLDGLVVCLDGARNRLVIQKQSLLLEAKWAKPFKCDRQIEREIECLTKLCDLAIPTRFPDFGHCYKKVSRKLFAEMDSSARAALCRLSEVDFDPEAAARRYLARIARPGSHFWRKELQKFMEPYTADLRVVLACIQKCLAVSTESRRQLEVLHFETLEREFEPKLLPAVAVLKSAVVVARGAVAEARSALVRESASAAAIRAIWEGLQGKKQIVYRQPKCLGETDLALASQWGVIRTGDDHWKIAMESARGAELIALDVYRELHGVVEDLSVQQVLNPEDDSWWLADIRSRSYLIDVKNAMQSKASRNRYTEHHVKRFKKDSDRRDVVLSGFLSPYPQEGQPGYSLDEGHMVCWLGETSLGEIERIKREFESDYLQLDLPTDRNILIPPWLFDYPRVLYAERDAGLARVCAAEFAFPLTDCPVGAVVMAGRVPKPPRNDQLSEEAYALSERRCKLGFLSRPVLYLHILDRFCRSLTTGNPFPAGALRNIILPSDSPILRNASSDSTPLAVLDPLMIVSELINVLDKVSTRCALRRYGFAHFKLTGKDLFRRRRRDGTWQTILAYCGGWKRQNGGKPAKCGRKPLFIGQNEPCGEATCGYLICDNCGHCKDGCPRNQGIRSQL